MSDNSSPSDLCVRPGDGSFSPPARGPTRPAPVAAVRRGQARPSALGEGPPRAVVGVVHPPGRSALLATNRRRPRGRLECGCGRRGRRAEEGVGGGGRGRPAEGGLGGQGARSPGPRRWGRSGDSRPGSGKGVKELPAVVEELQQEPGRRPEAGLAGRAVPPPPSPPPAP